MGSSVLLVLMPLFAVIYSIDWAGTLLGFDMTAFNSAVGDAIGSLIIGFFEFLGMIFL